MNANNMPREEDYDTSAVGRNRKKRNKQESKTSLKIIDVKVFKIIVVLLVFASFLTNLVFGQSVHEINPEINNKTGQVEHNRMHNKSDINYIFYNRMKNVSESDKIGNGGNNTSVCPKEHHGRVRESQDLFRQRRRKERSNDRARGSPKAPDGDPSNEEDHIKLSNYGCNNTCLRYKRKISLEAIKGSILSKLGMTQPPNLKGRLKPKLWDHKLAALLGRRRPHHGLNGAFWVVQENDFDQMQGDDSSVKVNSKNSEFSNKNYNFRSHGNASDNRHSDSSHFQDGEIFIEEEDDYHIRTEKIVIFSKPHDKIRHSGDVQYFMFNDKMRNNRVKKVVLWVYIKGKDIVESAGNNITIAIYKILIPGKNESHGSKKESPVITSVVTVYNQSIPDGAGAWITLDYNSIKNLVASWFRNPESNLGIFITAEDSNGTNLAVTSDNENGTSFVPFLEVYLMDNKKHRMKRAAVETCNEGSNETLCCRYPLTVNFEEFGWDWIIAPKKYEANYCSGDCPLMFFGKHLHTHIIQLAKPQLGSCCVPKKLSAISILYFDNNMNIIFGTLSDMVVDQCGCA